MEIILLNWNIGGAKVLEQKCRKRRDIVKKEINLDLANLIKKNKPDIVTLQEVVAYKQPSDKDLTNIIDKDKIGKLGYNCFFFPLIDSLGFSSQDKWEKIKKDSDWDKNSYFSQGNGMLFRKNAPLFPCCDLSKPEEVSPGQRLLTILEQQKGNPVGDLEREIENNYQNFLMEKTPLTMGSYFGDRNTEPRVAIVSHLILKSPVPDDPKPIDIFILNVHLVTLMKERVGIPSKDAEATKLRINQLTAIFDDTISRFNSWYEDGFPQRGIKRDPKDCKKWETFNRHKPVWLLCGDFNFTEKSVEYDYIMRRNFIDTTLAERRKGITHSRKGIRIDHDGTKAKGAKNPATLTLDYIFAGPKFVAFDPLFKDAAMLDNIVDHTVFSSDHFPIISKIPLFMVK